MKPNPSSSSFRPRSCGSMGSPTVRGSLPSATEAGGKRKEPDLRFQRTQLAFATRSLVKVVAFQGPFPDPGRVEFPALSPPAEAVRTIRPAPPPSVASASLGPRHLPPGTSPHIRSVPVHPSCWPQFSFLQPLPPSPHPAYQTFLK